MSLLTCRSTGRRSRATQRATALLAGVGVVLTLAISGPGGSASAITSTHTIAVGADADGMAFSPDGSTAYVMNSDDATVSVIDVATHAVTDTIASGCGASVALSPDGSKLFLAAESCLGGVSVIDTATNTVTTSSPDPGYAERLAVSPSGTRLYVADYRTATLTTSNATTLATIRSVAVGTNPSDVRLNPAGTVAYVVNHGSDSVSVVNTTSNTVIATIAVGASPRREVLSPDGTRLYVATNGDDTVSVINTATRSVIDTYPLTGAYGIDISPDGKTLYVTDTDTSAVHFVNAATGAIIDSSSLPTTPYNVAVSPSGNELDTVSMGNDVVTTFDLTTPPTIRHLTRAGYLRSARLLTTAGSPAASLVTKTPKVCVVRGVRLATLATSGICVIRVRQSGAVLATVRIKVRHRIHSSPGVRLMHIATVPFDRGRAVLKPAARAGLQARLARLRRAHLVVVIGMANRHRTVLTRALSHRRAVLVSRYLTDHRVTVTATRNVAKPVRLRGLPPPIRRAIVAWL